MQNDIGRLVAVSRSGRYAGVRAGDALWLDDTTRGPRSVALPCDGDFAFAGDDVWVSHAGTLTRFALPSLERKQQLDIAATRLIGDGEQVIARTSGGWLALRGAAHDAITAAPDERVFPIGGGRRVHACDRHARVVEVDGASRPVELGGRLVYAASGLGRGWLALVDRSDSSRELAVIAGDHRIVRRIGVAAGAIVRSAAAGGRALVVTHRGHVLVVDLRTAEIGALDMLDGDRLDAACDATGRRVVAVAWTRDAVVVHQGVLAAA